MKLTKKQIADHQQACEILKKDVLSLDEKFFVLENWHEGANHNTGASSAFFTPYGLARDFALDVELNTDETETSHVVDLCAGIGILGFFLLNHHATTPNLKIKLTAVEINPDYVAVGRKILPEANWITGCAFAFDPDERVDTVISNPPFGSMVKTLWHGQYTGSDLSLKIIEKARTIAPCGTFIIGNGSAPFSFSGKSGYTRLHVGRGVDFMKKTGITLRAGVGIDTAFYKDEWRGTKVITEIVHFSDSEDAADRACLTENAA